MLLPDGVVAPRLVDAGIAPRYRLLRDALDHGSRSFVPDESKIREAEDQVPAAFAEYQTRGPIAFAVERLGIPEHTLRWALNEGYGSRTWDGTKEPFEAIQEALLAWEDVGVESGTGTGKSFFGAILVFWFIASWQYSKVFTFAPKAEQLRLYIWAEIRNLWPRFNALFPNAVLTDLRIRIIPGNDKWAAHGYGVQVRAGETSATKAQGMHAPHMLLLYEETPGIALATIEAGVNTCTADHNLRVALGNPDHQLDGLHLFSFDEKNQPRPGVRHVRISALDHPNVVCDREIIPGATTVKSVKRRLHDYTEQGRMYQSRVRGVSPKEAADALIKLDWVEAAFRAWEEEMAKPVEQRLYRLGKRALGVDVANSDDGDEAAIAAGMGPCLLELEAFPCPNANQLGTRVAQMVKDSRGGVTKPADRIEDEHVGVDTVGVGVGCYNEMTAQDVWPRGLNSGEGVEGMPDGYGGMVKFRNLRGAIQWQLREDLRLGRLLLKPDPELARDLITPTWETKNGFTIVESKEDIRLRTPGGKSPNKGDAVAYWNWVRNRDPIVEDLPKRTMTRAQRLQKELEDLDREEEMHDERRRTGGRFGGVLKQG